MGLLYAPPIGNFQASVARLALAITGISLPKTSNTHYNPASKVQSGEMMVYYRRAQAPGGSYFFTLTLQDRTSSLLIKHVHSLTKAFRQTRTNNPFITLAIVILPEHLHVLWKLPPHDCDYSKRWRQIKTYFTQALIKQGVVLNKNARGEYNLWQKRFWEHQIRDEQDLEQHVNYIHYNPVKHGLVVRPTDWEFSSIHRYIKKGVLPADWCVAQKNPGYRTR